MPSGEEVGLFIHILGVFGAAGAITAFILVMSMMRRAADVREVRIWAGLAALIERLYLFPVAALVLLVSGGYLVSKEDLSFGDGWITVSMIALIVAALADIFVSARKVGAIHDAAAAAPDGPIPQVLAAQITDPALFATAHTVMLAVLAVIWNMTTHPGAVESIFAVVIAVVLGVGSAAPMIARQQRILEGR